MGKRAALTPWQVDAQTGERFVPIPKVCGTSWWMALEGVVRAINCPSCREHGLELLSAMHDLVNWQLQGVEGLYDRRNFERVANLYYKALTEMIDQEEGVMASARGHGMMSLEVIANGYRLHPWASPDRGGSHPAGGQALEARRTGLRFPLSRGAGSLPAGDQRAAGAGGQGTPLPGLAPLQQAALLPILLDTTALSVLTLPAHDLTPFYSSFLGRHRSFTTLIGVGENLVAINRLSGSSQQSALQALRSLPLLPFREDIAVFWSHLRPMAPRRVNQNDLWMAAFALSYDLPLVTHDRDLAQLHGTTIAGRTLHVFSHHLGNLAQPASAYETVLPSGVSMETLRRLPLCTPALADKVERCIRDLKARGEDVNPWAICQSSIGCALPRKAPVEVEELDLEGETIVIVSDQEMAEELQEALAVHGRG